MYVRAQSKKKSTRIKRHHLMSKKEKKEKPLSCKKILRGLIQSNLLFLLLMMNMTLMESQVRQSYHTPNYGKLNKKKRPIKRSAKRLQSIMHIFHMEIRFKAFLLFMIHIIKRRRKWSWRFRRRCLLASGEKAPNNKFLKKSPKLNCSRKIFAKNSQQTLQSMTLAVLTVKSLLQISKTVVPLENGQ